MRSVILLGAIFISCFSLSQTYFGDPNGVDTFQESRIGRALLGRRGDLAPLLKREDEVDQYMTCYLRQRLRNNDRAEARMREFRTNYRPFILEAVQHFQIPYSLSACIMFRESFLDNSAVSQSGARSLAQFTPDTYETLKTHLRETTRRLEEEYEFEQMMNNPSFDVLSSRSSNFFVKCQQFTRNDGWWVTQVSGEERTRSRNLCRRQLRDFRINKPVMQSLKTFLWSSSRGMNNETYNRYFSTPRSQGWPRGNDLLPPSNFDRLIQNPMWLVAMNMFFLKRKTMMADSFFNPEGFRRTNDYIGYLTAVGGAYNRGPNRLYQSVQQPNSNVGQWCRNLATSEETRNYMLSLKRCMVRGSSFPMTGMNQDPNCTSPEGAININDPCETIAPPNSPLLDSLEFHRPMARPTNLVDP